MAENQLPPGDLPPPRFAIIYAPGRKRDRVPEQTVRVMDDEPTALREADPGSGHFAAEVIGPLRSSEGFRIFFVRRWL